MSREVTEITIAADGTETHESWVTIRANRYTAHPGQRLFDSEIAHQHYVTVTVSRCSRQRKLNHDWMHSSQTLMEVAMSFAQWGAFVSSFGDGSGVPATLFFDRGSIAQAPVESRMEESARDVRQSGDEALNEIREKYEGLRAAFERGAGKREMRDLIATLGNRIQNGPANMEFAAQSLNEHVENVVTKARSDLEAMAVATGHENGRAVGAGVTALLGESGKR